MVVLGGGGGVEKNNCSKFDGGVRWWREWMMILE